MSYEINISGTNTVTGLEPNTKTCSTLYMVEGALATVNINGETVWTEGKLVSHNYSYGAENDKVTTTYDEWENKDDGTSTRTVHETCSVCGWGGDRTETRYLLSFDPQGGTGADSDDYYFAGSEITLTAPTKDGQDFTGWNTAADGSGTMYGDTFTMPESPVKLYAQWKEKAAKKEESLSDDETTHTDETTSDSETTGSTETPSTPTPAPAVLSEVRENIEAPAVLPEEKAVEGEVRDVPATADHGNTVLWLAIMAAAALGLSRIAVLRMKKR